MPSQEEIEYTREENDQAVALIRSSARGLQTTEEDEGLAADSSFRRASSTVSFRNSSTGTASNITSDAILNPRWQYGPIPV